jgi:hypothetical protein
MNATITASNGYGETITAHYRSDDKTWRASIIGRHGNPIASLINENGDALRDFAWDYDFDLEGLVG